MPTIEDVRQLILLGRIDAAAKLYVIVARLYGGDPELTIYAACGFVASCHLV
jgi:hypothetical protein